jgi:glycosyltransferase 2 family protein
MRMKWGKIWRVATGVLAILIVGGVGWQFAKILRRRELWEQQPPDPAWVAAAALLYAFGFMCWGGFWLRLLRAMGEWMPLELATRAYFVSQLGKYVPGKGMAVIMRVGLARMAGVRTSVAAITATYETLTAIAAGAIVAAALFPFLDIADQSSMVWKALGLLAIAGIPILPGVFNRLAARVARPFLSADAPRLPRFSVGNLLTGLAQTSLGWLCLGASLLALLRGLGQGDPARNLSWLTCTACVSLSYVAGFLTVVAPGGIGVREFLLQQLLARQFAPALGEEAAEVFAAVAALALRLTWTLTELFLAGGSVMIARLVPRKTKA